MLSDPLDGSETVTAELVLSFFFLRTCSSVSSDISSIISGLVDTEVEVDGVGLHL